MRRLIVVQLLPALSSGGVERSTLEVAEALVVAGHRSIVVSGGGRLVDSLLAAGSEHVQLPIGKKSLGTLRHALGLRRLFERWRPDIVHARSRLPAWLATLALTGRRDERLHFITTVHGLNSPGWYSGVMTRGERVVCVSETVRRHVMQHWPATPAARLTVIEPGIDRTIFNAKARPTSARSPGGKKLLLMPGRGTRLKGHAAAIELLAQLRASGVDARLWLLGTLEAGRENYIAELQALAAQLDVARHLQISAPIGEVTAAYQASDLVLQLSSKPEAFGRTVVEALAVGTPVAGWAHGGVGELLARHFPQGAVALNDQAGLLATTLGLLENPPTTIELSPQTLAAMQEQTLRLYESVAG